MARPAVIAVVSQKGGAGKSTLTMQLAAGLARVGRRVAIVDLDPQGNSTHYLLGQTVLSPTLADFWACAEFCVNGPLAGNCLIVRSPHVYQKTRYP
mgnify:CR=1 FL=1